MNIIEKFFGSNYFKASLAKLTLPHETLKKFKEFLDSNANLCLLQGIPGSGKSYICAALINELWKSYFENYRARFFTTRSLISLVKEEALHHSYESVIEKVCECHGIILDDFGFCLNTEWQKDVLNLFVDIRTQNTHHTQTLITTNLTPESIKSLYGERCYSRLFHHEHVKLVMPNIDKRIKNEIYS